MKRIKLTESQFETILREGGSGPAFNGGDLKEYPGSEVGVTTNVHNSDDELEYGEPQTMDDIANDLSPQNPYGPNITPYLPR